LLLHVTLLNGAREAVEAGEDVPWLPRVESIVRMFDLTEDVDECQVSQCASQEFEEFMAQKMTEMPSTGDADWPAFSGSVCKPCYQYVWRRSGST